MASYRQYLRIASNRVLLTREKCSHKNQDWKDKDTLYWRCGHCNSFIPFRNPEDIKRRGEFGRGGQTPIKVVGVCVHIEPTEAPEILA